MKRIVIIILLFFGVVTLITFVISTSAFLHDPVEIGQESEISATTTVSEQLSECQYYYKYVFPSAKVYGTFEEYPVTEQYTGRIAEIDLESHAVAKRFYTHHLNALKNPEMDFAGKYSISSWGFTGVGTMFAVIDKETGKVYPFPYVVDWDFDFRPDSNLLVINPIESVADFDAYSDFDCEAKWYDNMKTYYFLFEGGKFVLLENEDSSALRTSDWLSNHSFLTE